jgi:recombination protein RecA
MYIDLENSLDLTYATHIGVDASKLRYVPKPPSGEIALNMIEAGIRGGIYSLIVVDSVAAMAPAAVLEASNEQLFVAAQARMLSQALLKLNNAAVNSDAIILWVNQERANIAPGPHAPTTTPGGYALRYYCNIAMRIARTGPVEQALSNGTKLVLGQKVKVSVKKNKIGPPMREATCHLIYGDGIRRDIDLALGAIAKGVIKKNGGWYTYEGEQLGQGLKSIAEYEVTHPGFLDKLEKQIYNPEQLEAASNTGLAEAEASAAESAEE